MLLIYPPVAKPCEPPAGLARLAGALRAHHIPCRVVDANLEGLLSLLHDAPVALDTWTARAGRGLPGNLQHLTTPDGYINADRYKRAVADLNRVLTVRSRSNSGVLVTLGNYQDPLLSPVRSGDLLQAAERPESSPFYFYFKTRLPELLQDPTSDVIGFSLNFLNQALSAFAMIGFIRKCSPKSRIILGGGLVTSWMRMPGWKNPFQGLVDDLVDGPGEKPLLSLLGRTRCDQAWSPDYQDVIDNRYLAPGFILPYSASSGCYWQKCSFCPERAEGNPYQPIDHTRAIRELATLVDQTSPVLVHLLDNAISPALLKRLTLDPPAAPWYGFARVTDQLVDRDFCLALKRSGCVMLKLGLESGDQGVLDALQKGVDLRSASTTLRMLSEAGIATYVYLLFGTPPETESAARRTLEFTAEHASFIGFLNLALFNLPAYGPDVPQMDTRAFYEGDLSLYRQFSHPTGWDRGAVRQFLDKEVRRHPAIAPVLRRDPPVFTSNHAAFWTSFIRSGR